MVRFYLVQFGFLGVFWLELLWLDCVWLSWVRLCWVGSKMVRLCFSMNWSLIILCGLFNCLKKGVEILKGKKPNGERTGGEKTQWGKILGEKT